ncbi:MAG: PfkB family carbohydrate kinase [Candidatus Omnitrophota bacterium]
MGVLIVGSIALDTIKTPFRKEKEILGGSATYSSISARFFSPVHLVAVVGEDFPKKHINFLRKKGVDLEGLQVEEGKTFRWEGEYGWDFCNPQTIATDLNVFGEFNPSIPRKYQNTPFVFLANIDPALQKSVLNQVKKPKLIACDTMNYWIDNKPKQLLRLLKDIDILLVNESEAKQLTGKNNLMRAGKSLRRLGPKVVMIKKGEHGVLLFSDSHIFATPAYLLETIVDPTGAGDTFAGTVIGYLSQCKKLNQQAIREAVVYGNIMATFTVEDFSVRRLSAVTPADFKQRMKEFRKFTAF